MVRRRRGRAAGALLRFGAPGRIWALDVCMVAVAAALYGTFVQRLQQPQTLYEPVHIPWPGLAVLFGAAEIFVVHLHFRRDAHSFSLSEVPLVLGLFFVAPLELLWAQILGTGIVLAIHRKQPVLKLTFNLCRFCLETCVAVLLFRTIASLSDPLGPLGWVAAFAATFAVDLIAGSMIELAMSLTEEKSPKVPKVFGIGNVATFTNSTLALVGVTIVRTNVYGTWMLFVLAGALFIAYHAYGSVTQKHEALQVLNESTRTAYRVLEVDSVALALMAQAREMFRADIAELTLFPPTGEHAALVSCLGPGEHSQTMVPTVLDPVEGVWARVASEGQGVLLPRPITNGRLKDHYSARGIKDAMVAPLRGEAGIVGTMTVANRLGDIATFKGEDMELFETLVNHASVSLENFRLVDTLRHQAEENEYLALHDALTGLPNRTLFRERTQNAIAAGLQRMTSVAIIILDLDRFKEVNDTLGHHTGDLLLQEIGLRLKETLRDGDTVARLGGDEFAILLPDVGGRDIAAQVARKVLASLRQPLVLQEMTLDVRASMGIATFPDHGVDADTLVQRADVAMYLAKESHSGYEIYHQDRDQYSPHRLALVAELRNAIELNELTVFYQPKANLASGAVTGVEALVRWNHPRHGLMAPDSFIPIAEHTGLIKPLTLQVLDTALAQCRAWHLLGTPLDVAVNLSARNFDLELPDEISTLLDKWGVPPTSLHLELTESSILADPVRTQVVLSQLSAKGIGIAIDDFGTGYSSLSHLRRLPVQEIKIDKSFVMGMASDENDAVMVRSIVDLGRNLGLRVVAEGVESKKVYDVLAALGCDFAQGYFLSKPVPAEQLNDWLAQSYVGRIQERT